MQPDISSLQYDGSGRCELAKQPTAFEKALYKDKDDYHRQLDDFRREIDELQNKMYAHDRYAMLLIFQAMDAAGKDGTIQKVMSGVNPHGVQVRAFKQPSQRELDHDFLWRTYREMPERGKITIFNRSYYEEVVIVRVHADMAMQRQKLPRDCTLDLNRLWQQRYKSIRHLEEHLAVNGTVVVKFFLHVSSEEQRRRFISRIDRASKNWKFSESDIQERAFWDDYMHAYGECIAATGTPVAPWYVIPADDKMNMRLAVCQIILDRLRCLESIILAWAPSGASSCSIIAGCSKTNGAMKASRQPRRMSNAVL